MAKYENPQIPEINRKFSKAVYMTIRNPAFYLILYLTGVHFWGKLQHVGDVSEEKISMDQSELKK